MGKEIGLPRRQPDQFEELGHARADGLSARRLGPVPKRLGDDVADLHARIEGGIGVLQHHLTEALQRQPLASGDAGKITAGDQDAALSATSQHGEDLIVQLARIFARLPRGEAANPRTPTGGASEKIDLFRDHARQARYAD
jgi:hypothetical protein